jgi:hypothetical protein
VRLEGGILVDVDDYRLRRLVGRPAARRSVVVDHGEVVQELTGEPALCGDPQLAGRLADLNVASLSRAEGKRGGQDPIDPGPRGVRRSQQLTNC